MTKEFGITSGNLFEGSYEMDHEHDGFDDFLAAVKLKFNEAVASGKQLFTTDAEGLYEIYLDNIPEEERQYYRCRNCQHFIERVGNLVNIGPKGEIESVMWDVASTPPYFKNAVNLMKTVVRNSRVTGLFIPDSKRLGVPKTGEWTHFSVDIPRSLIHNSKIETAEQLMAKKREEYKMLNRAIADFSPEVVDTAIGLLQSTALFRAEKNVDKVLWFKHVINERKKQKTQKARNNIVWLAVAAAPTGFTHIRSKSLGVLLKSVQEGLSFEEIKLKMDEIMHPLKYQRAQTAPKAGNIARAEKIFQELGLENSLHRRFARIDELNHFLKYKPRPLKDRNEQRQGVFGHLYEEKKKKPAKMVIDTPIIMTWKKFAEEVMPYASEIEYKVKDGNDAFSALTTAVYPTSAPILQWDKDHNRNPFAWYVYAKGSTAHNWNLRPGWVKVTGIVDQPSMWGEPMLHQGESVFFLLDGARDMGYRGAGNAIFPETLKSELHEVRSTIEKYSKGAQLEGFYHASACGIRLQKGSTWNAIVRVTNFKTNMIQTYKLDRWD